MSQLSKNSSNHSVLKKIFCDLVSINSASGNEQIVSRYIIKLIPKIKTDQFGNLYLTNRKSKILLTAHMDTVEKRNESVTPVIKHNIVYSNGKTVLGADNKAGLAILLMVYKLLPLYQRKNVEFLFTANEELGMQGAKNANLKMFSSKFALSLDKSDGNFADMLVVGCKSASKFEIIITGKIRHAARCAEVDSANLLAYKIIGKFFAFQNSNLKHHIYSISGLGGQNVTADLLVIKGVLRGDQSKIEKFISKIALFSKATMSNAQIKIKNEYVVNGYLNSIAKWPGSHIYKELVQKNYKPKIVTDGSIGDAAVISVGGIPTFTLSVGNFLAHQTSEYADISEMSKAVIFLINYIKSL